MSFRFLTVLALSLVSLVAHGQQATAAAPPTPDFAGNLLQLFFGLALVLGLLVGALWLLKQITQRRGDAGGLMRVVSATAVGTRERVVIVEVGATWLVLGVAPGRVSALAEIPRQAVPPDSGRRPATDLPGWMRSFAGTRGNPGGSQP